MAVTPLPELPSRSLLTRYLTLSGAEIFSKLCVMGAFVYLAHVLSAADYGTVELALSITVFFVLSVESGMGLYGARVVAADASRIPRLVPQVMVLRLVLGVPAFLVILAVSANYRIAGLGILAITGIAVLLTPLLTQWVFQGLRQMQWVAAGSAIRYVVFTALILLTVHRGGDIRLVAVAEVSGVAALALFNAWILHGRLRIALDWHELVSGTRQLFGQVWFMGFSDLTWAGLWYSPALIVGWLAAGRTVDVAWIAASVRIVVALHTFVWLYFFNMLPNMAKELSVSVDAWRALIRRSIATSVWPAGLVALGGTLVAPWLMPLVYGAAYSAAVRPFQIVIWMIPVAWFSGHFRFSLIAAGQQRWEVMVSVASALVTVTAALTLAPFFGSVGAALALLLGGTVNLVLAVRTSRHLIASLSIVAETRAAVIATAAGLAVGLSVSHFAGAFAGTVAGCLLYVAVAARQDNDVTGWLRQLGRRSESI